MFEKDFDNWLKSKNEIEFFEELDESVKKGVYNAEQKLVDHEEINLVKIDKYLPDENNSEIEYELYFDWIGYNKEIERAMDEENWSRSYAKEIVDRGGYENIKMIIEEFIPTIEPVYITIN